MEQDLIKYFSSKLLLEFKNQIAEEVLLRLSNSKTFVKSTAKEEELLTPKELCLALKISESHFYKLKKKYENFPYYDLDGTKRYKLLEVTDFFKNQNL